MTKLQRKVKLQKYLDKYFLEADHQKFLISKHPLLGDRCPIDMLNSDKDFRELMDMFDGMESGSFV
jgi:uncharacterized protein (DUF2384 family)